MKLEKAYCIELNKIVTPYEARYAFFDEGNVHKKFHFRCLCGTTVFAINIDKPILYMRQCPHFRTGSHLKHNLEKCDWGKAEIVSRSEKKGRGSQKNFKDSPAPKELILNPPQMRITFSRAVDIQGLTDEEILEKIDAAKKSEPSKVASFKTRFLEDVVDSFLLTTDAEKKALPLKINAKTKTYYDFFKEIMSFKDEEGLIYYGDIKPLKIYGQGSRKSYKIVFLDKILHEGKKYQCSIYIRKETVDNYRLKNLFVQNIEELEKEQESAVCYFVGTYPQIQKVHRPEGDFLTYQVELSNLDHLVIKFKKKG